MIERCEYCGWEDNNHNQTVCCENLRATMERMAENYLAQITAIEGRYTRTALQRLEQLEAVARAADRFLRDWESADVPLDTIERLRAAMKKLT